ncbi:unnamed protein product, partial [Mesorhabditis belari]|uniref:Uncharacterized protein n=1 Tax=Mesorhabditis belari TaxID=2138241 RepID=A0AAF3F6C7_9BILA
MQSAPDGDYKFIFVYQFTQILENLD